jgi:hypothetical protein
VSRCHALRTHPATCELKLTILATVVTPKSHCLVWGLALARPTGPGRSCVHIHCSMQHGAWHLQQPCSVISRYCHLPVWRNPLSQAPHTSGCSSSLQQHSVHAWHLLRGSCDALQCIAARVVSPLVLPAQHYLGWHAQQEGEAPLLLALLLTCHLAWPSLGVKVDRAPCLPTTGQGSLLALPASSRSPRRCVARNQPRMASSHIAGGLPWPC